MRVFHYALCCSSLMIMATAKTRTIVLTFLLLVRGRAAMRRREEVEEGKLICFFHCLHCNAMDGLFWWLAMRRMRKYVTDWLAVWGDKKCFVVYCSFVAHWRNWCTLNTNKLNNRNFTSSSSLFGLFWQGELFFMIIIFVFLLLFVRIYLLKSFAITAENKRTCCLAYHIDTVWLSGWVRRKSEREMVT